MATVVYKRQRQILDFLNEYIDKYGHAPTLVEIAKELGVRSLATVHEHLQVLERKGLIKKTSGIVRGIELIDKKIGEIVKGIELPLLGFIAAGSPIEPYTDPNATFAVSPEMVPPHKKSYVLQVKGDSMIEDGILEGDFVVVEETNEARDGDIVVAMVNNGVVTLKRYFKESDRVRLEPANSALQPIYAKNVTIQGRCVGVIRKYN
ncbi:repressor LexA [Candidatus Curtissbacteria bacterium RIFCSPHIGHO2_01_FULL_41_44]|uniref:LexA repressor n=1 Tax=Candidatus Curtissbacteria bacterium RIFCSPLOWO2_01_FULL_42_50 TaxID=1797730 RepID=A0A1F5H4F8_9BACT|nr:MAG: repressor LexA [Candidatus Curtissbacteria bacterium RIFCSPHIGHO2_01_FULL_41_44]OGD93233.1 MAG: repressor LexA [Candidatus Curtissbacteria bacterium RIFCSPHIGHO2_02_FULL_42_58]OGD96873.1 MAG: repressor LexA [Candidatus Curtissbacteria bacterium RIFCSPHIGHO2_12_FULL_42_33]OGD98937.1 MAG: repressor LexA [Candidatus Curtissbacteria bacterium RIFCSPLOWO2_01_FULL_42_50]OGE03481.1 MAG: repressor LexA [Candidatus Curtissbacteria bacterium RIFCSPLOWO2_12_FULL_41_16]OGE11387.1 MAG: repressor Le